MRSDIELLRIVSAFGIVWFHSGCKYGRDIGYAGLIVFLIISAYFSIKSEREYSVIDRAWRLIVPCVTWSILYASFSIIRGKPMFPSYFKIVSKILATPSIHLWYLPFAFFFLIAIDKTKTHFGNNNLAVFSAIFASILLLTSPWWRQWNFISPLGQYMHAFPAVLIGILLASSDRLNSKIKYFLIGLVYIAIVYIFLINIKGVGLTYFVGVSASFLLLKENSIINENILIIEFSKLTFGIYLAHPLILFVVKHFGINSIFLPVSGFIISSISIYLLYKFTPKLILKYVM